MEKRIEMITLTRMDRSIDESSLESNEDRVTVSYEGLAITEHPRGEKTAYLKVMDIINSTRGKEPKEIIIRF